MKTILFFISVLVSSYSLAQGDVWTEDYGPGYEDAQTASDEKMRWLYDLLFEEHTRKHWPDESFKSFRVHLKDSYKEFPQPTQIAAKNLKSIQRIQGSITYVSIVAKKYIYDLSTAQDGTLVLNVRIHLKKPTAQDISSFAQKIKQAENIWNSSRVPTDFKYAFKFDLVSDVKQAHFSVNVLDSTRGPYDTNWSREWGARTIAHEIGHMMGLGDEYQTLSGKTDCWVSSLMCSSWEGSLLPHHYYFVLRRLVGK